LLKLCNRSIQGHVNKIRLEIKYKYKLAMKQAAYRNNL